MANLVKFYLGSRESYSSTDHAYGLYFTTDTNEILLNGSSYGGGIDSASYSDGIITFTMINGSTLELTIDAATTETAGLLSAADKTILDLLATLAAADNSINITDAQVSVNISSNESNTLYLADDGLAVDEYTAGDGITITDNVITVDYPLSSSEKTWIAELLFDSLFSATITVSPSSAVYSGTSYTVTWTLTCTYDGTNVDLDSTPSGWTYVSTGVYTKTTTVSSSTTSSSVSSGSVTCTYGGNSKTASSKSSTIVKYSYIYTSTNAIISSLDDIDLDTNATLMLGSTTNTISGSYDITVGDDEYVYFIISPTSSISSITQLGLNYLSTDSTLSGYTLTRTDYGGNYTIYRSANSMSASTLSVTVA